MKELWEAGWQEEMMLDLLLTPGPLHTTSEDILSTWVRASSPQCTLCCLSQNELCTILSPFSHFASLWPTTWFSNTTSYREDFTFQTRAWMASVTVTDWYSKQGKILWTEFNADINGCFSKFYLQQKMKWSPNPSNTHFLVRACPKVFLHWTRRSQ